MRVKLFDDVNPFGDPEIGSSARGLELVQGGAMGASMSGRTNDPRGYFFASAAPRRDPAPEQVSQMMGRPNDRMPMRLDSEQDARRREDATMAARLAQFDSPVNTRAGENARLQRTIGNLGNSVASRKVAASQLDRNRQDTGTEMASRDANRGAFASILQSLYGARAVADQAAIGADARRFAATEGVRRAEISGEKGIEKEQLKQTSTTDRALKVAELVKNKDYDRAAMLAREGMSQQMIKATSDYALAMLNNSSDERIAKISAAAKAKADLLIYMSVLQKDGPDAALEYLKTFQTTSETPDPSSGSTKSSPKTDSQGRIKVGY